MVKLKEALKKKEHKSFAVAFYQLLMCHGILITDRIKILIHMLGEMMLFFLLLLLENSF